MSISLKRQFEIRLTGVTTELCGVQFPGAGRRQLVPCPEGEIIGPDFHGRILSAGIDHQLIREDGTAEINAASGWMTAAAYISTWRASARCLRRRRRM